MGKHGPTRPIQELCATAPSCYVSEITSARRVRILSMPTGPCKACVDHPRPDVRAPPRAATWWPGAGLRSPTGQRTLGTRLQSSRRDQIRSEAIALLRLESMRDDQTASYAIAQGKILSRKISEVLDESH
jgi:hypothetical protein